MSDLCRVVVVVGDASSCSYYRSILPSLHCFGLVSEEQRPKIDLTLWPSGTQLQRDISEYDVFWFARVYGNPEVFQLMLHLHDEGKRLIWDLDDDLTCVPEWSPHRGISSRMLISQLQHSLHRSSAITVSTQRLKDATADKFSLDPDRIHVLENLVDTKWGSRLRAVTNPGFRPYPWRILWTGSDSHNGDIGPFLHVYEKFKDDKRVIFVAYGWMPPQLATADGRSFVHIPWGAARKNYESTLGILQPTIALCPLADIDFNHRKSSIKYFETVIGGAVPMVPNMPPFSDTCSDENAVIINPPCDHTEWEYRFGHLLDNPDQLSLIHNSSYDNVFKNYSWNWPNLRQAAWREFYEKIPTLPRVKLTR